MSSQPKTRSLSDLGGSSYDSVYWLCVLPTRSIRLPDFLYYNCHWVCFIYINSMRRLNIDLPNLGVFFFFRFLHFALEIILGIWMYLKYPMLHNFTVTWQSDFQWKQLEPHSILWYCVNCENCGRHQRFVSAPSSNLA